MRKRNETNIKHVVFSQWSRKNYAIFSSLKKVVNIGRLSVDICRTSLLKCTTIIRFISTISAFNNKKEEEINEYEFPDKQFWEQLCPFIAIHLNSNIVPEQKDIHWLYLKSPYFA